MNKFPIQQPIKRAKQHYTIADVVELVIDTKQDLAKLIISTKSELKQDIEDLAIMTAQQFTLHDKRFDRLEGEFDDFKDDMSTLKSDVSTLKSDVIELKNDMATVKGHLAFHDKRFDQQDERLERLENLTTGINEDLKLVLPKHEFRIEKLEKAAARIS